MTISPNLFLLRSDGTPCGHCGVVFLWLMSVSELPPHHSVVLTDVPEMFEGLEAVRLRQALWGAWLTIVEGEVPA